MMKTGERVKNRRCELGITQTELARKINTKQPTIQSMEQRDGLSTKFLLPLSKALKVSIEWIITGEDQHLPSDQSARDHQFINLIDAPPGCRTCPLFRELVQKKRNYDDLFEELTKKRGH